MLSILYGTGSAVLPCFFFALAAGRKAEGLTKKELYGHFAGVALFLLLISAMFAVTGFGSVWDIGCYDELIRWDEVNTVLFDSEGRMTYVLNIFLFVPFGFMLPLIWKEFRKIGRTVLAGGAFSLAIEGSQLFNRRTTDVDDLLMNTLGAVWGFFLWECMRRALKKMNGRAVSLSRWEPVCYLVLACAGEFFLYNWRLAA